METTKGFEYVLDSTAELDLFAKGVLALVNIKSSRRETIADVRTVEGMNRVIVVSYIDLDEYFKSNDHVWEVVMKDPMTIISEIEFSQRENKTLDKMMDNDEDYFFHIVEN